MERRRVPGTDLELSVVGFGCWAIGGMHWGPGVRDEDSIAAVHAALDAGIDWFDTAPLYGHGHADEVLARALGPRIRDVTIATKVGVRFDPATDRAESDLSPSHVREDCEASLARLGVERIDLLQVHWPCERGTPIAETMGALADLVREGKVRSWGLCNYDAAQLRTALDSGSVATLETPLSMVRREVEEELLPLCRERGVAVLAYETLCRGLLTNKFLGLPRFDDSDLRARDDRFFGTRFMALKAFAHTLDLAGRKMNAPPEAIAIGWALTRPGVTAAIVGAKTADQVRRNARGARLAAEPKLWPIIDRLVAVAPRS